MSRARSRRGLFLLLIFFISSHITLIGCNDESRTSGTVVQVSEESKKNIESKRDMYKALAKEKAQARKDKSKVGKTK
jgi:hypothetical protein